MGTQFLGYAATLIVAATQVPQLLKVVRTRETHDLSMWTYALILLGSLLYIPYAFAIHSMPVALTNLWLAFVSATILSYILANGRKEANR